MNRGTYFKGIPKVLDTGTSLGKFVSPIDLVSMNRGAI